MINNSDESDIQMAVLMTQQLNLSKTLWDHLLATALIHVSDGPDAFLETTLVHLLIEYQEYLMQTYDAEVASESMDEFINYLTGTLESYGMLEKEVA